MNLSWLAELRDLCTKITPIQASSRGRQHTQSNTAFRNLFPGTSHRKTVSCPRMLLWIIRKCQATLSRPGLEELSSPTIHIHRLSLEQNVPRDRCHMEAPRKQLQHMDVCVRAHLTTAHNFCARTHKIDAKLESALLSVLIPVTISCLKCFNTSRRFWILSDHRFLYHCLWCSRKFLY